MRLEQNVVVQIVDTWHNDDDVYEEFGIEEVADSDGMSSAEEAFMRGYLAAEPPFA